MLVQFSLVFIFCFLVCIFLKIQNNSELHLIIKWQLNKQTLAEIPTIKIGVIKGYKMLCKSPENIS